MKNFPRKLRARRDLHEGRGYDYLTWWLRYDEAPKAERVLMLRGKHHPDNR